MTKDAPHNRRASSRTTSMTSKIGTIAESPWAIALIPTICLAAYVGFGRPGLITVALALPILFVAVRHILAPQQKMRRNAVDPITGLGDRAELVSALDIARGDNTENTRSLACFAIGLEDFDTLTGRYGDNAAQGILIEAAQRLDASTRGWDVVTRLDGPRFGIGLTQLRRVDLEMAIEIAARFQTALAEPFTIGGTKVYATVSVGVCLPPVAPELTAEGMVRGAERALDEAMAVTGGAIRRYSQDMLKKDRDHGALRREAAAALNDGRIEPWYQPQVSTDTGLVSGVEVLARWVDPDQGLISPADFLPVLEAEGLLVRLGEVMLDGALTALAAWDQAGQNVPNVGINVTEAELRDPNFCDRVKWELDRFGIEAKRLTIEVLESVTSDGTEDIISRSLAGLARLGCQIDLDDFGTGNASLASVRRYHVHRLKIDRSYISHVDTDASQRAMVAAIVTMAEQLGLETLAEGVETLGEHAMVAQLGCLHVQGYAVARPMPFGDLCAWLDDHSAKTGEVGVAGLKIGSDAAKGRRSGGGKTA